MSSSSVAGNTEDNGVVAPGVKSVARETKRVVPASVMKRFQSMMAAARMPGGVEKSVEHATALLVSEYFSKTYGNRAEVVANFEQNSDGLVYIKPKAGTLFDGAAGAEREFSVLIETKIGKKFSPAEDSDGGGRPDRSEVLCQAVGYLKKFSKSDSGKVVPSVVVVADDDEIFAVGSNVLLPYLARDYDWSVSPSASAWIPGKVNSKDPEARSQLFNDLSADGNLALIHVEKHDSIDTFDPDFFMGKVAALATGSENLSKLPITKTTLAKAFEEFNHLVFGGETAKQDTKVKVSVFIRAILDPQSIYFDNTNKNRIFFHFKDAKGRPQVFEFPQHVRQTFNANAFEMFFAKWDRSFFSIEQRKELTEIADSLFEDFDRRFTGDFWTPRVWVDEAHRMIERQLGEDWRDKFVVWDAACGSKNLTRDYKFANLYSSTLHQEELNIAEQYNPEATSFQYDFLNDDMDLHALSEGLLKTDIKSMNEAEKMEFIENQKGQWKLPDALVESLVLNKPIVFFMNPPYGSNGNINNGESAQIRKAGVAQTKVAEHMRSSELKMGHAIQELYTQFIYRVQMLADTFGYTEDFFFFFFFNKGFLSSPNFAVFSSKLKNEFTYKEGFMLNAGEFGGTSSAWGIIFSGWEIGGSRQDSLNFNVLRSISANNEIRTENAAVWDNLVVPSDKTISILCANQNKMMSDGYPTTKNGFETTDGQKRGRMTAEAFGYFHNHGNSIQYSDKFVGMYSMCFNGANGTPMDTSNFTKASVVFSVRKSWLDIIADQKLLWVRDKDIFPTPSETFQNSESWTQFEADCVVYSLFAMGSNQTGLRAYEYGTEEDGAPKKWRVKNEFFWLPRETVVNLATTSRNLPVLEDADRDGERFVYNWLTENSSSLSEDAQKLLKLATEILEISFKYRSDFYCLHPKFDVLAWDAGWQQVRRMCFGNDALPDAKADKNLQELHEEFKQARRSLGDSIAHRYSEDTGF